MRSWQDGAGGKGHSSDSVRNPAWNQQLAGLPPDDMYNSFPVWLFNLGLFCFQGHWFFGEFYGAFFEKILNLQISYIWPQKLHQWKQHVLPRMLAHALKFPQDYMGVSENGFFHQNGWWKWWKTLLTWMILGYHYFWKHPHGSHVVVVVVVVVSETLELKLHLPLAS